MRGFRAARAPRSNYPDSAIGRVCWARSPMTVIDFFRFEEYLTAEHAKHFILPLCEEFKNNLLVVLDGAPYF